MGKSSPVVDMVVEGMRGQIKSGSIRRGYPLPSEKRLGEIFDVSRGTVRIAIERLIRSGELRRQRHARPFVATPSPSSLGNEIYVWVSRPIADRQAMTMVAEISRNLKGAGYRLVVKEPSHFTDAAIRADEREFLENVLHNPNAAGAILERDPYSDNRDLLRRIVEGGRHLVFIDTLPPEGVHADFVGTSNATAARRCTEHLIHLGHSRIGFVADCPQPPATRDRLKGFRRAVHQAGIAELATEWIAADLEPVERPPLNLGGPFKNCVRKSEYFAELASRVVRALESAETPPTALFFCHDVLAFWVCGMLEAKGIAIPRDLSVVGFDHLAHWDDTVSDVLTSARQDFPSFGVHAANLILDRLGGEAPTEPRHVLLDAPLIARSSTTSDLSLPLSPAALVS